MALKVTYGWTNRMARVNVSTGRVSYESTEPYHKYIGGMGFTNAIMYHEVPAGTHPFDEANKFVLAVGPLTASGVPLSGRSTAGSLSTYTTDHLVVEAHMGGMIGGRLKLAGLDALIVEGKSDHPVYIHITNNGIAIKDASDIWGLGTRDTNEVLSRRHGRKTCVAAIGPAGENLLPYAVLINSRNHSGGAGIGSVLGSKKVKAIAIEGLGAVRIHDPKEVSKLSDHMLRELLGSNNNHVVPQTPQSWAEYHHPNSRWTARKGLYWGAAEGGPVETGECKAGDINTVGMRCMKSVYDLGPSIEKYTVKMDGCFSCPIHCFSDIKMPGLTEHSSSDVTGSTCVANFPFTHYFDSILKTGLPKKDPELINYVNMTILNLMDDLGVWCNYGQLYRDIAHCHKAGVFKRVLPKDEYDQVDWEGLESADPNTFVQIWKMLAANDNELAYVAHGPDVWCERWNDKGWFDNPSSCLISPRGWPVHHAIECCAQVGALYNVLFNRDCMLHSAVNFDGSGLPYELKQEIAAEIWGDKSALDAPKKYTPMNEYKAKFAWWSLVTNVLHDSLVLCNWVWPMTVSPTKARNYRGDLDMEAKFYTAVTGEAVTTDDLYKAGARIMTLQRANTIRGMGTVNMREKHDLLTSWAYDKDPDIKPFTPGTDKMERSDFQLALSMIYKEFKWDEKTGGLTRSCLEYYDLPEVADELESLGLLVEEAKQ